MHIAEDYSRNIYIETMGEGKPVVVLHGWGMHGGIFRNVLQMPGRRIHLLDLPGHGFSRPFPGFADVSRLVDYLLIELETLLVPGTVLLGWSMGGLLAQVMAARLPHLIEKLVLVTATPLFVTRSDWQLGVSANALEQFGTELTADYAKTLARFLALQFLGADASKTQLRQARDVLFARPAADPTTLQQGLALLKNTDTRASLANISCPTLVLNGEHDLLVTTAAARYLAEQLPVGRAVIIRGAGHAPFLSHQQRFNTFVQRFIDD